MPQGAPVPPIENPFADDFGFETLPQDPAAQTAPEEDVKTYTPRHLQPQPPQEAAPYQEYPDQAPMPGPAPEAYPEPAPAEYGPSDDEVEQFINSMDIDYEDEPEPQSGGASRFMWPIALGAAVLALLIALFLLFRSCTGPGTGNPTVTSNPSATPGAVITTQPGGEPGSDPGGENTPAPEDLPVSLLPQMDGLSLRMERGASQKLDGGNVTIHWHTSDEEVVTVDGYGVITAVGAGNATILAVSGEEEARISIAVYESEFSPWMEELPAGISSQDYEIESASFYRFREKELTTSTESSLEGWTLYSSDTAAGSYGEWSDWQTTPGSSSATREVQSVTQYSYRTVTEPEQYSDWGDWGEWTAERRERSNTLSEDSRKTYRYFYYTCPKCGIRSPIPKCLEYGCGTEMTEEHLTELWSETAPDKVSRYEWANQDRYTGTEKFYRTVLNSSSYFLEVGNDAANTRTEYRYRSRTHIPAKWSAWSEWQLESPAANASTEVQERTLYRYRDMSTQKLNYFERWADWSEPVQYVEGQTALISTDTIEYEQITMVRYREK